MDNEKGLSVEVKYAYSEETLFCKDFLFIDLEAEYKIAESKLVKKKDIDD